MKYAFLSHYFTLFGKLGKLTEKMFGKSAYSEMDHWLTLIYISASVDKWYVSSI
jgi:hypothetical protein